MSGLKKAGYLKNGVRRFETIASALGVVGVVFAVAMLTQSLPVLKIFDLNSFLFIVVGTVSVVFLQFDLKSIFTSIIHAALAFLPFRTRKIRREAARLDELIESGGDINDLENPGDLCGRLSEDLHYLYESGLSFDEIDEILSSSFVTDALNQRRSAELFLRASQVAPALGLLGTVVGLVGVMRSLGSAEQIGPAMSLALMTTAYGAALGTLVFGPLAGRLDAASENLLHFHRELVRKSRILYLRADAVVTKVRRSGSE